jgi:hypothetical protein
MGLAKRCQGREIQRLSLKGGFFDVLSINNKQLALLIA